MNIIPVQFDWMVLYLTTAVDTDDPVITASLGPEVI